MARIGLKQAFRAIYWLAAIWLLLAGIKGLVGLVISTAPTTDLAIPHIPTEAFYFGTLIGTLIVTVEKMLTLMGGALLLPPVIDRVWTGGFFIRHWVYRVFGILLILSVLLIIWSIGFVAYLVVFKDVPMPPIPTLSVNKYLWSVAIIIAHVLLGLMFFPFCTKHIRKDLTRDAPKTAAEGAES